MRRWNWAQVVGFFAALFVTVAVTGVAQKTTTHAPYVHLSSRAGAVSSNYVEPVIDVSEDAYVFAVAVDLDGNIQVLHPEYSGLSVRLSAHRELQLKNFFAGFGQDRGSSYSRGVYSYGSEYSRDYREDDVRGFVIALASRAPFNFEKIETGGDWDESAIRNLILNRTPGLAARNLAHYIGAAGEQIGQDFLRVAGQTQYRYAYFPDAYANPCGLLNGYGFGPSVVVVNRGQSGQLGNPPAKGLNTSIVGFDVCGRPIVAYTPTGPGSPAIPGGRIPRFPHDTTIFPKTQGIPATGSFPAPARSGTIPAYPRSTASEERAANPQIMLGEQRRRLEQPHNAKSPAVEGASAPMPRVQREPGPAPSPRNERDIKGGPAQGSFGAWGLSEGSRPAKVIEAPPRQAQRDAAPAPARTAPMSRPEPQTKSQPVASPPASPPPSPPTSPPPSRKN